MKSSLDWDSIEILFIVINLIPLEDEYVIHLVEYESICCLSFSSVEGEAV